MAQLEILEGSLQVVRGRWGSATDTRIVLWDDSTAGRCEKLTHQEVGFEFSDVNQDDALINGQQSLAIRSETRFTPSEGSPDGDETAICNASVFADRSVSSASITLSGTLALHISSVGEYSKDAPSFNSGFSVTDCEGTLCAAALYGKQNAGNVDIISGSTLRWRGATINTLPSVGEPFLSAPALFVRDAILVKQN
jgi:hypothetical protein